MKMIIISMAIAVTAFTACNNSNNKSADVTKPKKDSANVKPAAEIGRAHV